LHVIIGDCFIPPRDCPPALENIKQAAGGE
jgi:hypothetical protein